MGNFRAFGAEELSKIMIRPLMVHPVPTGLKGYRGEIEFRPCVDGEMRFRNSYGAAHPPRPKGMKGMPYHFGSHKLSSLEHPLFNHVCIDKSLVIAFVEINENKV